MNMSMLPMPKERILNRCKSMMGCSWRHSQITTAMRETTQIDGHHDDEVRAEPVVALAFIENDLQGAEAEREQAEADVVNPESARSVLSSCTGDR